MCDISFPFNEGERKRPVSILWILLFHTNQTISYSKAGVADICMWYCLWQPKHQFSKQWMLAMKPTCSQKGKWNTAQAAMPQMVHFFFLQPRPLELELAPQCVAVTHTQTYASTSMFPKQTRWVMPWRMAAMCLSWLVQNLVNQWLQLLPLYDSPSWALSSWLSWVRWSLCILLHLLLLSGRSAPLDPHDPLGSLASHVEHLLLLLLPCFVRIHNCHKKTYLAKHLYLTWSPIQSSIGHLSQPRDLKASPWPKLILRCLTLYQWNWLIFTNIHKWCSCISCIPEIQSSPIQTGIIGQGTLGNQKNLESGRICKILQGSARHQEVWCTCMRHQAASPPQKSI